MFFVSKGKIGVGILGTQKKGKGEKKGHNLTLPVVRDCKFHPYKIVSVLSGEGRKTKREK